MRTGSMVRNTLGLILVLGGSLFLPASGWAQEEHRVRGEEVSVFNLAGSVEIVAGSGNEVVVQVTRGGGDAGRLEIGLAEVEGREALIVRYPSERVVYPELGRGSRTTLRVRADGSFYGEGGSSGSREVELAGSGQGMEAWADLRIAVPDGQDFALFLAAGETHVRNVNGTFLVDTGSGPVEAHSVTGELVIDTGSGDVVVEGFDGELEVDTGSGHVELTDVSGDDLTADTGSGDVTGSGIRAGALSVDTGSGEVVLSGVACPNVTVDTGSGEVELELLQDVDELDIDTGSGSVTVRVPDAVGARMVLDTGSGGIDMGLPLEVQQARRNFLQGVLGDGDGTIRIDTGSGNIRIVAR